MYRTFLALILLTSNGNLCFANTPHSRHVILVIEENHVFNTLVNGQMPYLKSLADSYALATNYYANSHASNRKLSCFNDRANDHDQ
jgi:hypothetical protein